MSIDQQLSIGEVAARTGVSVAALRMWEARHGFPAPDRGSGGHRRYSEADCESVAAVVGYRSAGWSLEAAVARVRTVAEPVPPTVFGVLRRTHPGLLPQLLPKWAMTAISRAIEDECLAGAAHPVLIGCFQQERFYHQSQRRWRELARGSRGAVVFADFPTTRTRAGAPVEVPVPAASPLRREWAVACAAPGYTACLSGWERPQQRRLADEARLFEAVWTTEPDAVVDVVRACAGTAATAAPEAAQAILDALQELVLPRAGMLHGTLALSNRIVAYLAQRAPANDQRLRG